MGRALIAVGAALALCFVGLGALVFLDRREDLVAVDSALAEDISRELTLANGRPDPVAFTEITDFGWDRVLIVAEDTATAEISRALGFEFKGHLPYDAESGELFVFARGAELARFADYRGRLEFAGVERPIDEMFPDQAVFRVSGGVVRPVDD